MSKRSFSNWQGFLLLALIAVLVRLLFFSGLFATSDFIQALRVDAAVSALQRGDFAQARVAIGGIKEGVVYAPYVLLDLLGVNGFRYLIPTLIFSIANLYVFYRLVREIFDEKSAAVASLFLAFLPIDIFYATGSLNVEPGVFFFFSTLWAGTGFLGKKSTWNIATFAICFAALILWAPWLAVAAIFVAAIWLAFSHPRLRARYAGLALLGLAAAAFVGPNFGSLFISFVHLIQSESESLLFIPLLFVALASGEIQDREKLRAPLILAGAAILSGIIFLNRTTEASSLIDQPTLAPLVMIFFCACIMLGSKLISSSATFSKPWPTILKIALIAAIAAVLAWAGRYAFITQPSQFQPLGALFTVYAILAGVAFLAILISPLLLAKKRSRSILTEAILVLIVVANLSFANTNMNEFGFLSRSLVASGDTIKELGMSPIYVLTTETYNASQVLAPNDGMAMLDPSQTTEIDFGYVLLSEQDDIDPGDTWAEVGKFGELGSPRTLVYQVAGAQTALDRAQGDGGLLLVADLINAGRFCQAYATWSEVDTLRIATLRVREDTDCLQTADNEVATEELQSGRNMRGFINYDLIISEGQPDLVTLSQASRPIPDMGTSGVTIELEPNSVYLYSIEIQTEGLTGVLYYADKEDKDYLALDTFPKWITVAVLVKTPNWETSHSVYLSPAIFEHLEDVNLRSFFLGKVVGFNEAD